MTNQRLALNEVEHWQTNGFGERFHGTVQEEFFQTVLRQRIYPTAEDLQPDLDVWIEHYNTERPHQGYRNRGKRRSIPSTTI